jgi:hypothetical protein
MPKEKKQDETKGKDALIAEVKSLQPTHREIAGGRTDDSVSLAQVLDAIERKL